MVCFSSKYLKSYNFGKRTNSEKRKPVSDSVTQKLPKKVNPVKKTIWCLPVLFIQWITVTVSFCEEIMLKSDISWMLISVK